MRLFPRTRTRKRLDGIDAQLAAMHGTLLNVARQLDLGQKGSLAVVAWEAKAARMHAENVVARLGTLAEIAVSGDRVIEAVAANTAAIRAVAGHPAPAAPAAVTAPGKLVAKAPPAAPAARARQ